MKIKRLKFGIENRWSNGIEKDKVTPLRLSFTDDNECLMSEQGKDYRGHKSTTVTRYTCQAWNSQSPWKHEYKPNEAKYVFPIDTVLHLKF